jgi:hypothetical protein
LVACLVIWVGPSACDKAPDAPPPAEPAQPATEAQPAKVPDVVADAAATKAKDLLAKSKAGEQLQDLKAKGDQLKSSLEDQAPPLTPERYEELVLALASCELKDRGIDSKCEQYQQLQKAKQSKSALLKDLVGVHGTLGRKHLGHENPAVRFYAAGLMGSGFANGVSKEDVLAIVKAAKTEADPIVLAHMLDVIGSSHGKDPAAGKLLISMTSHPSELVRKQALGELATWGKKTQGVVPAFQKAIQKDKSPAVRAYACGQAGELGSEKLLPVMQKLAMDKKTDKKLYASCFQGIVNLWTKYPFPPEKPSPKAYQTTLKMLAAKPRSEDRPPWGLVSAFYGLKQPKPEWLAKAKFFQKPKFFQAVSGVVTDPKANWMLRNGFVELLGDMQAPKALFVKMRKAYKKPQGDDSHVIKKLDEAIAKAK